MGHSPPRNRQQRIATARQDIKGAQKVSERARRGTGVGAFRNVTHLEIALAEVDTNDHVLGSVRKRSIDQLSVARWQSVNILSSSSGILPHLWVGQISQVGVVKLQVAAPSVVQSLDLLPVRGSQVGEEIVQIGVSFFGDTLPPATEVKHGGRRDGDLDVAVLLSRHEGLEIVEVVHLDILRVPDLAGHSHGRWHMLSATFENTLLNMYAIQIAQIVQMKKGAT